MYETFDVPVDGGTLRVGAWGDPAATPALAAHGITGNHLAWAAVGRRLAGEGLRLVAPDLRGRGGSSGLPGPYGMAAHADDLAAVLDHLGASDAVIVGHSMGAYVAKAFAARHPGRAARVVLVDGGIPLAADATVGADIDAVLEATIGPALQRLRMTFADADAYVAFFRQHPALGPHWDDDIEAYVRYDLAGEPPACRSTVRLDAVRVDGEDIVRRPPDLHHGATLLRADHGMLGEPGGLLPADHVDAFRDRLGAVEDVAGTNHYTILLGGDGRGPAAVAAATAAAARR